MVSNLGVFDFNAGGEEVKRESVQEIYVIIFFNPFDCYFNVDANMEIG